jgi:hypothetical protein
MEDDIKKKKTTYKNNGKLPNKYLFLIKEGLKKMEKNEDDLKKNLF